jgi:hypothetical protein
MGSAALRTEGAQTTDFAAEYGARHLCTRKARLS